MLYFSEVKYRSSATQGGGMAAITRQKYKQMVYAAECYVAFVRAPTTKRRLAAASVDKSGGITYIVLRGDEFS